MQKELRYSEEGLLNRVLFLSRNNDINVFVEDEFKEYEYECILNRLFERRINIINIFPMKGKLGVQKAFKEYGTYYNEKPAIYIVDGDFDILLEKDIIENSHYIYLDKYNIESYYVDRHAVIQFMIGKLKQREQYVIQKVEYDFWEYDTYKKLETLFINHIIVQRQFPQETNVGYSPYKFVNHLDGIVSKEKIDEYVTTLKSRISNYDELKIEIIKKYEDILEGDPSRLICGKYILASLSQYLRKKLNVKFKEDDFKYHLICQFDINKLGFLKEKIENIIGRDF